VWREGVRGGAVGQGLVQVGASSVFPYCTALAHTRQPDTLSAFTTGILRHSLHHIGALATPPLSPLSPLPCLVPGRCHQGVWEHLEGAGKPLPSPCGLQVMVDGVVPLGETRGGGEGGGQKKGGDIRVLHVAASCGLAGGVRPGGGGGNTGATCCC
jgi:hypothetical protein